jgi:hypothetical protein
LRERVGVRVIRQGDDWLPGKKEAPAANDRGKSGKEKRRKLLLSIEDYRKLLKTSLEGSRGLHGK